MGLIGKKIGMTQVFSRDGERIPVTVVEAGPCVVVQKKTMEKDGYSALQLGFSEKKPGNLTKPSQGHFKALDDKAYAILREVRFTQDNEHNVGDKITVDIFKTGEKVTVSGISKGKGFAGNIKRWGFGRGPMTHGSKFHRAVGSSGMSANPSKVLKGKKMPGHLGTQKVTVKNIEVVDLRQEENILLLKGAVPGGKNGIITIFKAKL